MLDQFQGKKIAILGFGKEGQATLRYLSRHGVAVNAVLDAASEPTQPLPDGVLYVGGKAYLDNLNDYDFLFRAPGVPRMHPKLAAFPNQEAIYSQMKLFFDTCAGTIVAVTGTKGKTTTTTLLYEMLKAAGRSVFIGGNMGQPVLDFVDEVKAGDLVVLEMSSFQAQDLHKSPHVGVILNVTHDHLDDGTFRPSSHVTQDEYMRAKANLIAHQLTTDFAVLHPDLGEIFTTSGQGQKVVFHPNEAAGFQRIILGNHNLENISAAATAAKCLAVPEDVIRQAVADFPGVDQRLQLVGESGGVKFYNDSASTNPDSTIAAISSFTQPLVLIVGGSEKGLDYAELGQKILSSPQVKGLVVIGEVASQILAGVPGFAGEIKQGAKSMSEIVTQAKSLAESGDVILLSPAAASFDMFKNSKDRGEQFNQEVAK